MSTHKSGRVKSDQLCQKPGLQSEVDGMENLQNPEHHLRRPLRQGAPGDPLKTRESRTLPRMLPTKAAGNACPARHVDDAQRKASVRLRGVCDATSGAIGRNHACRGPCGRTKKRQLFCALQSPWRMITASLSVARPA